MRTETVYIAYDETVFRDAKSCEDYEKDKAKDEFLARRLAQFRTRKQIIEFIRKNCIFTAEAEKSVEAITQQLRKGER
ncbi:MAG: hypothetical protein F6K48_03130 [Okeania sp. SIO3H1]|nr:hypothetical protein [Okeania sp. SIO3H1]